VSKVVLLFSYFTLLSAWTQSNSVMSFGGGCGDNRLLKRFKNSLVNQAQAHGFEEFSSFADQEERVLNENAPGNKAHLENQLSQVVKKYENKDCDKEECQFLFSISAHGYPGDISSPVKYGLNQSKKIGHAVCLANNQKYPVANFKPYLDKLKKMGVKIGIIDESCFSGGSALELSEYGCVLSVTSSFTPHTAIQSNASHSGAYNKVKVNLENPRPTMQQMMIASLVNQTFSGMKNLPLMRQPDNDTVMDRLNKVSEFIGYKESASAVGRGIYLIKNMSADKFASIMKLCKKVFDNAAGKPMETIQSEQWYKDFSKNKEQEGICRKLPVVRNHRDKLAAMNWDQGSFDKFKNSLECEFKQNLVSSDLNHLLSKSISDLEVETIFEKEPIIQNKKIDANIMDEAFQKIELSAKDLSLVAQKYGFKCSAGLDKAPAGTQSASRSIRSSVNIIKNLPQFGVNIKPCVSLCTSIIKANLRSRSFNSGDDYFAAGCINKMKAIYLMTKEVQKAKEDKLNPTPKSACEDFKI